MPNAATSNLCTLAWAVIATTAAAAPDAQPIGGKVVAIIDGDTVDLLDGEKTTHRIRLHGIDAPEKGAPFSRKGRQALADLVLQKQVAATPVDRDRYGRTVARLQVDNRDVGLVLLDAGWVWHFTRYDRSIEYAAAERRARDARRGLWADPKPIPPWEWRGMSKAEREPIQRATAPDDR